MKQQGWIAIHRKIQDSPMYQELDGKQRSILFDILLLANHSRQEWDYDGKHYVIEPGQFVTSLAKLTAHCAKDVTQQNIRTVLKILKKWKFLTNDSTKQNRTITICNWGKYQSSLTKQSTINLTKSQQRPNKDLTTNNNDKNVNNENNTLPPEFLGKLLDIYNSVHTRSLKKLHIDTEKNIVFCLSRHSEEEILEAIESQPFCNKPFLKEIGLDTLFRRLNHDRDPVDYIESILRNTK